MYNCPINKVNGLSWTPEDLVKKFSDCYVKASILNGSGKEVYQGLVYITSASDGNGHVSFQTYPEGQGADTAPHQSVTYSRFILLEDRPAPCVTNVRSVIYNPRTGVESEVDTAAIFTYNPARQWRRGFHHHNSYFQHPIGNVRGGFYDVSWTPEAAKKILEPEFTKSVDEALSAVLGGLTARALTNRYWVVKTGSTPTLYSRKTPLGSFMGKKFFPGEGAMLLLDELSKELPDLRIHTNAKTNPVSHEEKNLVKSTGSSSTRRTYSQSNWF